MLLERLKKKKKIGGRGIDLLSIRKELEEEGNEEEAICSNDCELRYRFVKVSEVSYR